MPTSTTRVRLSVVELESRVVPSIEPILVKDWTGAYQIYGPTILNPLESSVDPNDGATLDFSSIRIITPPTKGRVDVDPTTGAFAYTPNYLLPAGLPKGEKPQNLLPEFFTFTIKDDQGAESNVATVTFNGGNAPALGGYLTIRPGGAVTNSITPVTIDVKDRVDTDFGVVLDAASITVFDPPKHGTVTYDPIKEVFTYTPDFGYVGYDQFAYGGTDTTGVWRGFNDDFVLVTPTATPRLQADPLGGQMLVIDGTSGNDTITVTPGRHRGDVIVTVNGVVSGPFHPTGRIVVFGYGGNDKIVVSDKIRNTAWLDGGAGSDTLIAVGGPSVLLGGIGDDTLVSLGGRDLMIGGAGSDTLIGDGNDILVGGTTDFDADQAGLDSILREWKSRHGEAQRVANLTGQLNKRSEHRHNGDVYLTSTTVHDDDAPDKLYTGGHKSLSLATGDDTVVSHHKRGWQSFVPGILAKSGIGSSAGKKRH